MGLNLHIYLDVGKPKRKKKKKQRIDTLTYAKVQELGITYNPLTGNLHTKDSNVMPTILRPDGYLYFAYQGNYELVHRFIWLIQTGKYPTWFIDHKNNNRSDNRWENLREADNHQNAQNAKRRKDNSLGVKGVTFCSRDKMFIARIQTNGVRQTIGYFYTLVEAEEAIKLARVNLHKEFANHG